MATTTTNTTLIVPDSQEHSKDTTMAATTISSLPTEIHLKIIKNLDRVSSVCLGITNKKFYAIHKELHPKIPLIAAHLYPKGGIRLFGLLKEWMKEAGLFWSSSELKFVTPERKAELRSHPRKMKLVKGRESLILEVLRDEKLLGGWWKNGEWVDGVESGEGRKRWVELQWNDVEWEGGEKADDDLIWDL